VTSCSLCGSTEDLEQHHVTAVADGGAGDGETVTMCRRCHHRLHWERGDYARWKKRDVATLREAFGEAEASALLARWGSRGGQAIVEHRGREYMSEIGRRGGQAIAARPGRMRELGYLRHGMRVPVDAQDATLEAW